MCMNVGMYVHVYVVNHLLERLSHTNIINDSTIFFLLSCIRIRNLPTLVKKQ